MTEQINDQISAFIDDELSAQESAMLVRRFERDPDARGRALRYTMIGDALRGQLLEPNPAVLRRRVAAALSGAQAAAAPARASTHWSARFARPALGLGIAAGVAVAAIGVLRIANDTQTAPVGVAAAIDTPAALPVRQVNDEALVYVVPQDVSDARVVTPPIRLTNYLMHHSEYASRLSRTSVRSNVVSAPGELPEETTEVRQ